MHIGARAVACGLKKATRLNGERATVTRKEDSGGRLGVIFDTDLRARAVPSGNLQPMESPRGQSKPNAEATAEECAKALLFTACETLAAEGSLRRSDIAYRAEAVFARGRFGAMGCGEPTALSSGGDSLVEAAQSLAGPRRCHGTGTVDFVEMMVAGGGTITSMREWFLSGMCHTCQKRTLGA